MRTDEQQGRLPGKRVHIRLRAPHPLANALAFACAVVLLVVAVVFSLVIFAVVAVGALSIAGYLWWKWRGLRSRSPPRAPRGLVIDGEATAGDDDAGALARPTAPAFERQGDELEAARSPNDLGKQPKPPSDR